MSCIGPGPAERNAKKLANRPIQYGELANIGAQALREVQHLGMPMRFVHITCPEISDRSLVILPIKTDDFGGMTAAVSRETMALLAEKMTQYVAESAL